MDGTPSESFSNRKLRTKRKVFLFKSSFYSHETFRTFIFIRARQQCDGVTQRSRTDDFNLIVNSLQLQKQLKSF